MTMTPDDLNQLWQLLQAHAWIPLAALLVHVLIRFEKANPWVDSRVPARWRPLVALILGQAAAVIDALTQGTKWPLAVAGGLLATLSAVFAHDFVIEGMRDGREFFDGSGGGGDAGPNLKTPVTPMRPIPPPPRPPMAAQFIAVAATTALCALSAVVGVLSWVGCNLPAKTVHDIAAAALTAEQAACVLTEDFMGNSEPAALATVCGVPAGNIQAIIDLVTASHKAQAEAAIRRAAQVPHGVSIVPSDAGGGG